MMNKKLAIAAMAMTVSTQAFAIVGPRPGPEPKKACISTYKDENGVMYVGNCDETENNAEEHRPLLENGCAKDQAQFSSVRVEIPMCHSPRIVQL